MLKAVPEIVAIGQVGQCTVQRLLASADTAFNPPEDGTGRNERAAVEEIGCLSSRDFCALIPRVDRNPEAPTAFGGGRVAFTAFPLFNQRGNARRPWHRDRVSAPAMAAVAPLMSTTSAPSPISHARSMGGRER